MADCELECGSREERVCLACAATLHGQAWFETPGFVLKAPPPVLLCDSYLEQKTKEAFDHCVAERIIPRGIWGVLLWFAIRQAAWRFLESLIRHWWTNRAQRESEFLEGPGLNPE